MQFQVKKFSLKIDPTQWGGGMVKMTFLFGSGHCMYFLAKTFFSKLTLLNPVSNEGWQK